jgi:hypothetical protein
MEITIDVRINGSSIRRVKQVKYLGVVIDEKLSWSNHVDELCKKINPLIGAFRRCPKLQNKLAKMVYESFVKSRITGIVVIWSNGPQYLKDRTYSLIIRALRSLFKLNWDVSREEVHRISETKSLRAVINISSCKLIYKICNNMVKSNLKPASNAEFHGYPTRNRSNLRIMASRTDQMRKGVLNTAVTIFNELPQRIKNLKNYLKFKSSINNHFK